jgi:hypothetical protein
MSSTLARQARDLQHVAGVGIAQLEQTVLRQPA